MKIKAVISDLDGTLVDTNIDWENLRARVRELLGTNHPLKPLGPSIPHVAKSHDDVLKAFKIIEEEELRSTQQISYDPSLINTIKVIKALGIKFAIVTLRSKSSAEIIIKKLGIQDYVDILVTRDQSPDRATQVRIVLKALNVKPHEVIFVGDTEYDLNSCMKLGIKTIIICKEHTTKCLTSMTNDVIIVSSFSDVINYLK